MVARLVERSSGWGATIHALGKADSSIGRGDENDIVLAGGQVSRRHARIASDGGQYILHDLGSKNGTFLNGERVTAPRPLQHGDVIALAGQPSLTLVFEESDETVTVTPGGVASRGITVNPRTAEVALDGRPVHVTAKEYLALALLYQRSGALVTKHDLAAGVWPEHGGIVSDDSIEQVIARLRRKLEDDAQHPRRILTVRGFGYRLVTT
jgi:pSer/pThr/pTyr-binding forkhead associated (FHA) protein